MPKKAKKKLEAKKVKLEAKKVTPQSERIADIHQRAHERGIEIPMKVAEAMENAESKHGAMRVWRDHLRSIRYQY